MDSPRIAASFLTISLLAIPPGRAQQPSKPPASASGAGLLLALVKHQRLFLGSPSVVQYETWWIARDATGAQVATKIPDIIVPRKTGFWRLGIQHTCQLSPPDKSNSDDHGNISTEDVEYAVPVDQAPVFELNYPACDPRTAKRLSDDSYNPYPSGDDGQPPKADAPSECGWANLWFESVLPDLISVSSYSEDPETCVPPIGHSNMKIWVQRPETFAKPSADGQPQIPFDELFGPAGHRAWIRALAGPKGDCMDESEAKDSPQTGWSLKHERGQWRISAFVQVGNVCAASGDPKIVVPRTLTHAVPAPIPWDALEKQLPGVTDAYLSPDSSVLLATRSKEDPISHWVQTDYVRLFDFSGNKLGTMLLELPPGTIVMAEWATGRFVQSWTDTLTAIATRGLPAPIFKVRELPR